MKYVKVTIFTGQSFRVPDHIQRIDHRNSHAWQLRYGKWTLFSDHSNDGSGAKASLAAATEELMKRIDTLEAPSGLKKGVLGWKTTKLPLGISGPIKNMRKNRTVFQYHFGISIPRFGMKSTTGHVYIGTDNTITDERIELALEKAVAIRAEAERVYKAEVTNAKRSNSRKKEHILSRRKGAQQKNRGDRE